MATTDIVARLQLRAEQFSSETGARFAELKTRARSAAQDIRSDFTGAFGEVQRLAQTSLQMPRTAAGSLDLSREIAQLNASAGAAEIRAQALRELSIAQTSAAGSVGVNTQALRLEADASAVAALGEENHARELREKIVALQAVQRELDQTSSKTRQLTVAEQQASAATARSGQGFTMLGQQFNDFTVQVTSGQSAAIAFAQQLPQATYALSTMGGRLGAIGTFLTGPWGTALTIGTVVLTPFVAKLFESGAAAKLAKEASEDLASHVASIGNYFDLATGKIKETNQALIQYAALTNFNENKDKRKVMEQARKTGNAALQDSLTPAAQYGAGPAGGLGVYAPKAADRTIADIFANGPTAPGIDARLRAIAASGKANAATAKTILESRATFFKAAQEVGKNDKEIESLLTGVLDPSLRTGKDRKAKKPPKPPSTTARDEFGRDAADKIASVMDQFNESPPQLRQVNQQLRALDDLIEDIARRKPPGFDKLIEDARTAKTVVQDALDRPYREFVAQQRESLAVGELVLQGRDAEAEALQNALRLQQQMGPLTGDQLAGVRELAEQHERIERALEAQRRLVDIYVGSIDNLQRSFRGFLDDLDGNTGSALKNLFGSIGDTLKGMQRDLLTNAVFGGVDEEVERYVRKMTGKQTPAEILSDQAKAAGSVLNGAVTNHASAADDFVASLRQMTEALNDQRLGMRGISPAALRDAASAPLGLIAGMVGGVSGATKMFTPSAANDDVQEVEITGQRQRLLRSTDVLSVAIEGVARNLEKNLGIKVPQKLLQSLDKALPTLLDGMSYGSLGGSVFSSITGGKDNKLASSLGGVVGNMAGKELGPVLGKAVGGAAGKFLGSAAGPLGSIAGGILGNVIGGLFSSKQWSNATLGMNAYGEVTGSAGNGRGNSSIAAATGTANSVAKGVNQLADQLGAKILSMPAITLGTWDGKYRVADTATTKKLNYDNFGKNVLHDFGDDQQAAIEYAIRYSISKAVVSGISQASQNIIKSGQDLETAINKALMIEAIPRDLKAMLDPVGAAVDDLNRKWQRTVDALKEGGATTEQMAQAQRLYDLQLAQVKNSTASASQGLKDFLDTMKLGSSSPLSLRDQESTALLKLKPFLDQINAGQSVDQDKYQQAAQAYLDVERSMYGSTQKFFDAFDAIQAATNKAISAIDNAQPITPAVESPFAKATSTNTAATAKAAQATADMTEDTNALLGQAVALLQEIVGTGGGSGFIGEARNYKAVARS